jgi:hypothetical protein
MRHTALESPLPRRTGSGFFMAVITSQRVASFKEFLLRKRAGELLAGQPAQGDERG